MGLKQPKVYFLRSEKKKFQFTSSELLQPDSFEDVCVSS